ncbi:MAG: sigma-54-dependent Fis family transcriptional regulator [Acidobacteria bacterium]|nr:sigma-54-dependent Fis family transcriptional regulator [Acidobacteriota bacterium]
MTPRRNCILIIEDDPFIRRELIRVFDSTYEVLEADGRDPALEILGAREVDVVLVDMHLPPDTETIDEGLRALDAVRAQAPETLVLAMSGDGDRDTCLRAAERGAYDFFTKPIDSRELQVIVRRALDRRRMDRDLTRLQTELERRYDFSALVGLSPPMECLKASIRKVADSTATVIIRGESGTGKELVARAVHFNSPRRKSAFIALNCSALPENLVEDELFGHEKGAFTGADRRREGRFEMAHGGTLFLDEIGTLTLAVQAKLLRVLESRRFERVGGKETITVDFRLVAATNQDLEEDVAARKFRQDLYYRINVVRLDLPPLRARGSDVGLLAEKFLVRFCRDNGAPARRLTEPAIASLQAYAWPGNVRELEHLMESLSLLADGEQIGPEQLPEHIVRRTHSNSAAVPSSVGEGILWESQVENFERGLLEEALRRSGGVKTEAAALLGLKKDQMKYLCRKYSL